MKHLSQNLLSVCLFAATALLFTACSKDDSGSESTGTPNNPGTAITPSADAGKDNYKDSVVTGGIASINPISATIYGYVNNMEPNTSIMGIAYGTREDLAKEKLEALIIKGQTIQASSFDGETSNRRFTVTINNLEPDSTYYYYAFANLTKAKQVLKFKTPAVTLKTGEPTAVQSFSVILHASTNAADCFPHGFIYSTRQDFTGSLKYENESGFDDSGSYSLELTDLMPGTTYYYKSYALRTIGQMPYTIEYNSNVMSFTTPNTCPDNNHPHAIDLCLPSGTKWACCNVGASKPIEAGNRYAWGETETKESFYADQYQYCYWNGRSFIWQDIGEDIAGTQNDAATANMGNAWQMPNHEQCQELIDNTTIPLLNLDGMYFKGKNGSAIYIPHTRENYKDYYWLSDINNYDNKMENAYCWYFQFNTNLSHRTVYCTVMARSNGLHIRPIRAN